MERNYAMALWMLFSDYSLKWPGWSSGMIVASGVPPMNYSWHVTGLRFDPGIGPYFFLPQHF